MAVSNAKIWNSETSTRGERLLTRGAIPDTPWVNRALGCLASRRLYFNVCNKRASTSPEINRRKPLIIVCAQTWHAPSKKNT